MGVASRSPPLIILATGLKKAYREVLSAIFPKSIHVLCLAHIVSLGSQCISEAP